MIVDDSAMVRLQVRRALTEGGFVVVEAVDGQDALDAIRRVPELDLIVCDVNMPRMNGLELLEHLRSDADLPAVPVVMLTTEGQPELIQQARGLGALGWIVKPFKADLLLAAARKLTAKAA
jgi:two-component system chemotaxis response regulator CheY